MAPSPYSDDDVSFFVSFFDVPVGLGDLIQWIDAIDDRPELSRLNKLLEKDHVLFALRCRANKNSLAACH